MSVNHLALSCVEWQSDNIQLHLVGVLLDALHHLIAFAVPPAGLLVRRLRQLALALQ